MFLKAHDMNMGGGEGRGGTDICKSIYETDEMAATESRTTVGEAHDMNMGEGGVGGEDTDICNSVYETDEMAATESKITVGEAHDMNMRGGEEWEGRAQTFVKVFMRLMKWLQQRAGLL